MSFTAADKRQACSKSSAAVVSTAIRSWLASSSYDELIVVRPQGVPLDGGPSGWISLSSTAINQYPYHYHLVLALISCVYSTLQKMSRVSCLAVFDLSLSSIYSSEHTANARGYRTTRAFTGESLQDLVTE